MLINFNHQISIGTAISTRVNKITEV